MNQGGTLSNFQFFSDLQEIRPTYLPTYLTLTHQPNPKPQVRCQGFSLRFCSSASHDLALIYNDRAILENMHLGIQPFPGAISPEWNLFVGKKQGGQFVTLSLVTRVGLVCLFVCLVGWLVG